MAANKLYYGLWSQMSAWPVTLRAAVVLGFLALLIYLLLMPFWGKFCSLLLHIFNLFAKAVYILIYTGMEAALKTRPQRERAEALNSLSLKMEHLNDWILEHSQKLSVKRRPSFFAILVLYGVLIGWIALPVWMGRFVNDSYLPFVSYGNLIYQNCERRTLETAKQYQPLFKKTEEVLNEKTEQWLSLSEDGKAGANVREKATKNSRSVTIVSGDDTVLYQEQENGWVRVRLKDDTEGWIRDYLLEGVPSEP